MNRTVEQAEAHQSARFSEKGYSEASVQWILDDRLRTKGPKECSGAHCSQPYWNSRRSKKFSLWKTEKEKSFMAGHILSDRKGSDGPIISQISTKTNGE